MLTFEKRSDIGTVCQEIALCFCAPQTVVFIHDLLQCLFKFPAGEGLNVGNGIILLGINDLLAARQLGQLHDGLAYIIQAHDVGSDLGQIHHLVFDADNGILHVLGVAAAGAHEMGGIVVNIVEIDGGRKLGIGRTGKEVQAAIPGQQAVSVAPANFLNAS